MAMKEDQYVEEMLNRTALFFSKSDIEKVRNTLCAVSGLGGVGAVTAELLARWGVKRFRFLDMDSYESSNLNRQLFSTSRTLGRKKVDVAEERIKEINPFAEVEMKIAERVNNSNVVRFLDGADIVVQNADLPSAKLFYIEAEYRKIPLVNGYATTTGGRVQTFDFRKKSVLSKVDDLWRQLKFGKEKKIENMEPSEIKQFDDSYGHGAAASLNFVTNMVGCSIVAEAIKVITGKGKNVLFPNYLEFDTFQWQMKTKHTYLRFGSNDIKKIFNVLFNKDGR